MNEKLSMKQETTSLNKILVCIGVSNFATLKNTILIFSRSSLLNLQTVQARSVLGNPPIYWFFVKPPKNRKFGRGFNLPLPSRMGGGAHYENPLRKPVSTYGVPQGSISDHSYLFYMKIMSKSLLDLIIFADDANFLYTNRNTHWLIIRYLNESLNVKKAKYYFSTQKPSRKNNIFLRILKLTINNHKIKREETMKFL